MALLELNEEIATDGRWDKLGTLTGLGKYDARARVEVLWLVCIKDTNAVRSAREIDDICGWFEEGPPFAELLVQSRLAEVLLGESQASARMYRIMDAEVRMQWLVELRAKRLEAGKKGGRKTGAKAVRGPDGRFKPTTSKQVIGPSQAASKQNQAKPASPSSGASQSRSLYGDGAGSLKSGTAGKGGYPSTVSELNTARHRDSPVIDFTDAPDSFSAFDETRVAGGLG